MMCLIYGDKTASFEELLEEDKPVSIYTRNLQVLTTEIFNVHRSMSPSFSVKYFVDVILVIFYEVLPIMQCQM